MKNHATRSCRFVKAGGTRCRARVMSSSEFCFFHNPNVADRRHQARIAGGRHSRAAVLRTDDPDIQVKTVSDVVSLLSVAINNVRRGELDPKVANCVGYLASISLRALQAEDLEGRVKALELAVKSRGMDQEFQSEHLDFVPEDFSRTQ